MKRVAVLCGGRSHERAVSLRSGARVEHALLAAGEHEPVLVDVQDDVDAQLHGQGFDVAFIALHGRGGEDDTIQLACERAGLPYTGTPAGPCGAAFDKARAKRLLLAAGVPTPPFITFSEHAIEQFGAGDVRDEAEELGYPVVVKPTRAGSSLGTRFVDDAASLPRALISAMSYDTHVLVERHVSGRELSVTIIEAGQPAGSPRVLPPVEIVPRHADWFDYESRYGHGETEFTCPPEGFDDGVLERVAEISLAAFEALDIAGYGRVDLIVDSRGEPWVLEVAPSPGLTETSLVPVACDAAGVQLETLASALIADALERHAEDAQAGE
ncbi:MAG: ddl [Thermoleophilia bacterium]|nr:ddl [Thermoleophilia bacterium]